MDPSRKTAVMQFLAEAKLLQKAEGRGPIIKLSGADLSGANLYDVADNLSGADLHGATMPNGQKYEDWLKSKGSGKD